MKERRVVITGTGALTPIGNTTKAFWSNALNGMSGAAEITCFDTAQFKTRFACELKNFDPQDHMDRKEARKLDKYAIYSLVAAEEAYVDSGLSGDNIDKTRSGVIWASGIGGIGTLEEQIAEFYTRDQVPRFNPFFITKMISNMGAGLISIKYGWMGINYATVSACTSSANAIADAYNYIKWGKADVMIAGGAEAPITPSSVGGFNAMKALSTNNKEARTASRPFDKYRDGFVLGEGAGALILEDYEHAVGRGARIYAEVCGTGQSADAYHVSAPHPEGAGAILSMNNALSDGALHPNDIDYLNTHATSTTIGDLAEMKAVENVFRKNQFIHISATKSMTGHLLGAAGAIESILSVLSVYHNAIPPTINTRTPDSEIPFIEHVVFNHKIEKEVRYALSNTFGFGGHNASLVFGKWMDKV